MTVDGAISPGSFKKIYRIRGFLVGAAGDASACDAWVEWFMRGANGRRPCMREVQVLVIDRLGRAALHDTAPEPTPVKPCFAIGTGGTFAMCAMQAGADARRAVEIAAKFDPLTGGRIRWLNRN